MATVADLKTTVERIWQATTGTVLHDALEEHLRAAARAAVKVTLEAALDEELTAWLGFADFARFPSGPKPPALQRSGTFTRAVLTSYGHIPDLHVPKLRAGNAARDWRILRRHQRLTQRALDQLLYASTLGLSLRDLQELLSVQFGETLSRQAVNRVTDQIADAMHDWRHRPIPTTPPILIVDGVWITINYPTGVDVIDRSGHIRQQVRGQERVLLCALALWPNGTHAVLHFTIAATEDVAAWTAFWQALKARGLQGDQVEMVVSDGSKGLLTALTAELPRAVMQRCVVHKVRGFERMVRYHALPQTDATSGQALTTEQAKAQRRSEISQDALAIFQSPTQPEAEARLAAFVARWHACEPDAVKTFLRGIKRCFSFYRYDAHLHPLIRTTNRVERLFREFRARADEMGAFANETACLLVFHLVLLREHAKHDRVDFAKMA